MYWPDRGSGVDVEPTRKPVSSALRQYFTEGGLGQPPTVPGGDWFNQITNELLNVLAAAGIEPSKTDDDQLLQAINGISKALSAREALRRTYAEAGHTLVPGSFELGGTVTTATDVLLYEADGKAYSFSGTLPHTVDGDSAPADEPGMWTDRSLAQNAFKQAGANAVLRTAQEKMREIVTPLDFMTDMQRADVLAGTALIDVSDAFIKAASYRHIRVPGYIYLVDDQVDIQDDQVWEFQGAELTHTDDTKTILRVNDKSGWSVLGRLTLRGTLVAAATAAEVGLHITDCKKFVVNGVTARNFKGKGIWLDGVGNAGLRGDRGQFADCATYDCTVGRQIDAGSGAEYNTWTNFNASGCIIGDQIAAGNNTTIGGSIVDNTTGVRLLGGANHGHGMYVGTNINHNQSANIHATGVVNGYTFSGCHAYGNGDISGPIWFEGCKGMQFIGGAIDCWIYNDSGPGSGANVIEGNYFPGDYGVSLVSNNSSLGQLYVRDNLTPAGPSALNDAAPVMAMVSRSINQALTAGAATKVAWDVEHIDNRGIHVNGDFTIATSGTQLYEINAYIYLSASSASLTAASTVELKVNGVVKATWPFALYNGSNISTGGNTILIPLASGDVVSLWVTANAGATSPSILSASSRMAVMLRS